MHPAHVCVGERQMPHASSPHAHAHTHTHKRTPNPQGEEGHAFYIVESGQLAAFKDGGPAPVMAYGPGDYFGELALLRSDSRRAATVRCAFLWCFYGRAGVRGPAPKRAASGTG